MTSETRIILPVPISIPFGSVNRALPCFWKLLILVIEIGTFTSKSPVFAIRAILPPGFAIEPGSA
jgi:hypothetical protein